MAQTVKGWRARLEAEEMPRSGSPAAPLLAQQRLAGGQPVVRAEMLPAVRREVRRLLGLNSWPSIMGNVPPKCCICGTVAALWRP